jgi:hypothetical protein
VAGLQVSSLFLILVRLCISLASYSLDIFLMLMLKITLAALLVEIMVFHGYTTKESREIFTSW